MASTLLASSATTWLSLEGVCKEIHKQLSLCLHQRIGLQDLCVGGGVGVVREREI